MSHNKETFVKEYCLCRRIPYKLKGETLYINKQPVIFSVYNLTYQDLLKTIDNWCEYDSNTCFKNTKERI